MFVQIFKRFFPQECAPGVQCHPKRRRTRVYSVGKTNYFLALCVDISKMVRDTTKVTTVAYALSIATKVDDLELL